MLTPFTEDDLTCLFTPCHPLVDPTPTRSSHTGQSRAVFALLSSGWWMPPAGAGEARICRAQGPVVLPEELPCFPEHPEPRACSNAHACTLCLPYRAPSRLSSSSPPACLLSGVQLLTYNFLCFLPTLRFMPLKPNKLLLTLSLGS